MGLLQSQQEIRNQEDNVERLRSNLYRLEEFLDELRTRSGETGLVANILRQDLQVAQARQALFNAESVLLNSRNGYQQTLDTFKGTLGLPPQLCLEVADPCSTSSSSSIATRWPSSEPSTRSPSHSAKSGCESSSTSKPRSFPIRSIRCAPR